MNYLPELKWYLFVEQNEAPALAEIRQTLYVNLGISLVVTLVVLFLTHLALARYQQRMEELAATDKLTGLLNRQAFTIFIDKLVAEYRREPQPTSALLVDLDHFKEINDSHGHLSGDRVLQGVAQLLHDSLRESDRGALGRRRVPAGTACLRSGRGAAHRRETAARHRATGIRRGTAKGQGNDQCRGGRV